jgi:hypothetical protein
MESPVRAAAASDSEERTDRSSRVDDKGNKSLRLDQVPPCFVYVCIRFFAAVAVLACDQATDRL